MSTTIEFVAVHSARTLTVSSIGRVVNGLEEPVAAVSPARDVGRASGSRSCRWRNAS